MGDSHTELTLCIGTNRIAIAKQQKREFNYKSQIGLCDDVTRQCEEERLDTVFGNGVVLQRKSDLKSGASNDGNVDTEWNPGLRLPC